MALTYLSLLQVRSPDGGPSSIGTAVVVNGLMQVVLWLAVNSTSPSHIAEPIRDLIRRAAAAVGARLC
jgi:hypothetical protein